jgi:hypothetical protein
MTPRAMGIPAEKATELPILDRDLHTSQTSTKANRALSASDAKSGRIGERHRKAYIIREIDVTFSR